jgi:hypothetical protein
MDDTIHPLIAPVNFSPAFNRLFIKENIQNSPFFWGKKLDMAGLTMYYQIMGIVAKFKFMSPVPLFKIYAKNQLKSIGKNSFLCAAI